MPQKRNKKRANNQQAAGVERSAGQPPSTPAEGDQQSPEAQEAASPAEPAPGPEPSGNEELAAAGNEQLAAENAALREQVASLQAQLAAAQAELAQQATENQPPAAQEDSSPALSSKFEALQLRVKEADEKRAASWRELKGVLEDLNACARANASTDTVVE